MSKSTKGKGKSIDKEEFIRQLMDAGLPRILDMVRYGEDDDVLKVMLPLIEYAWPKLARTETTNTNDNKLTINVNWERTNAGTIDHITGTALESGAGPERT